MISSKKERMFGFFYLIRLGCFCFIFSFSTILFQVHAKEFVHNGSFNTGLGYREVISSNGIPAGNPGQGLVYYNRDSDILGNGYLKVSPSGDPYPYSPGYIKQIITGLAPGFPYFTSFDFLVGNGNAGMQINDLGGGLLTSISAVGSGYYSGSFIAPPGGSIELRMYAGYTGGFTAQHIDNISITDPQIDFITNGGFDNNLNNWTIISCSGGIPNCITHSTNYGGSLAFGPGYSGDPQFSIIEQTLNTDPIPGEQYTVYFDLLDPQDVSGNNIGSGAAFAEVDVIIGTVTIASSVLISSAGSHQFSFTIPESFNPQTEDVIIQIGSNGITIGGSSGYNYVDNVRFVGPYNVDPIFTSTTNFSLDEGDVSIGSIHAVDPNGQAVTYSLFASGSNDNNTVTIDSQNGTLSFINIPDYESPGDYDGNNTYIIVVKITDPLGLENIQTFTVTVNDVNLLMESAVTGDDDNNGYIDFVDVSFTLDIDGSSIDPLGGDFFVPGYTISSASEINSGVVRISLLEHTMYDTDLTPTVFIASGQSIYSNSSVGFEEINTGSIVSSDGSAPFLSETSPVITPTSDPTPNYTFFSSEGGSILYSGSCQPNSTVDTIALLGNNGISFSFLSDGTYNDCSIQVKDSAGNKSLPLLISPFTIDTTGPQRAHIDLGGLQNDPTNNSSIQFNITFDEAIDPNSFNTGNVIINNGLLNNIQQLTNTTFAVYVTASSEGNVEFLIASGASVLDDLGNTGFISPLYINNIVNYDITPPILTELNPISSPTTDNTPSYTFSSNEPGTIAYSGSCSSSHTTMIAGNNTIVFSLLPDGTYDNCQILGTDQAGNISSGLPVSPFTITSPGISLGSQPGNAVSETGSTTQFTVTLTTQPTQAVSIPVSSSHTGEISVSPATLMFDQNTRNIPQTITITGIDDDIVDGDQQVNIVFGTLTSLDSNYDGIDPNDISIINKDDDIASYTISQTSLVLHENGGTGSIEVVLDKEPGSDVTFLISSSNTGEVTVHPGIITFYNTNRNISQNIMITAIDDNDIVPDTAYITISVDDTNSHDSFDNLADQTVYITLINDDSTGGSHGGSITFSQDKLCKDDTQGCQSGSPKNNTNQFDLEEYIKERKKSLEKIPTDQIQNIHYKFFSKLLPILGPLEDHFRRLKNEQKNSRTEKIKKIVSKIWILKKQYDTKSTVGYLLQYIEDRVILLW